MRIELNFSNGKTVTLANPDFCSISFNADVEENGSRNGVLTPFEVVIQRTINDPGQSSKEFFESCYGGSDGRSMKLAGKIETSSGDGTAHTFTMNSAFIKSVKDDGITDGGSTKLLEVIHILCGQCTMSLPGASAIDFTLPNFNLAGS